MGRLRLAKLPYLVVLFIYIGRLVAIVHSQNENTQQDGGGESNLLSSLSIRRTCIQYTFVFICYLLVGDVNSKCSHLNSKRNCFFDDAEVRQQ